VLCTSSCVAQPMGVLGRTASKDDGMHACFAYCLVAHEQHLGKFMVTLLLEELCIFFYSFGHRSIPVYAWLNLSCGGAD
jgi:hypothetical protein